MPRLIFPSLTLIFAAFLAPATQASSITAFTDHTAWAAASGPLNVENFEEFAPGRNFPSLMTIGTITYRTGYPIGTFPFYPAFPFVAFPGAGTYPGSGIALAPTANLTPYELQFAGAWTLSLALDLVTATGASANFARPYTLTLVERDGNVTTVSDGGTASGANFHGFTSPIGIVQAIITPTLSPQGNYSTPVLDGVEYSHVFGNGFPVVSIGPALPEPASMVTLSLGIMGVALMRRRMRGNW
jgi:hypothetical protein